MNATSELCVWLDQQLVGRLSASARGDLIFTYASSWIERGGMAISVSLPLQSHANDSPAVSAFFANLLPEGAAREAIARLLQISSRNDHHLLAALGGDCAGALTLTASDVPARAEPFLQRLNAAELRKRIQELPRRPLGVDGEGIRISLAGAQEKLALTRVNNEAWALPQNGAISTHILKPAIAGLPGSVANEAFCMELARSVGLEVPESWIDHDSGCYVVARYGRSHDSTGALKRVHQEDFCQALGLPYTRKYENEGGPGFPECFDLLRRHSGTRAIRDQMQLLDWAIFNFMIGNHDAHGKNLSLLYRGKIRLAPFYDLLSTAIYPGLSESFAMSIGSKRKLRYLTLDDWRAMAGACRMAPQFLLNRLDELSTQMVDTAQDIAKSFVVGSDPAAAETIDGICQLVIERKNRLAQMHRADALAKASPQNDARD